MYRKTTSTISLASCGLLVFLTFSFLAGCQTTKRHWPAMTGQVLDAETDEPIQDAIVLANWQGAVSYSNTRCFHQVRDITDEQGRFNIPAWENQGSTANSSYQNIHIYAHKYGYRRSEKTYKTQSYRNNVYYLERDETTPLERLRYLGHLIGVAGCGSSDGIKQRMLPFDRSIYLEAAALASTPEEKEILKSIQAVISLTWRDRDKAAPSTPAQFDDYFEQHVKEELLQ